MRLYALTVVLSAFLLFLVQPIAGRILLPPFGGSAAVWATCLLFFQVVLLLGYLYSHWSASRLRPRWQALIHASLLTASVLLMRLAVNTGHGPSSAGDPTGKILGLLAVMVGLPFLALSASTPLLQAWYAQSHGSELPYRLFAFSNAGSLAGLLCYPVAVEPYLSLRSQTYAWCGAYVLFALLCGVLAVLSMRGSPGRPAPSSTPRESRVAPQWRRRLLWVALAACSSSLLLAVTNLMTKDVAPVPFLWILPLSLYLVSFIFCFAPGPWYSSGVFGWLLTPALFALTFALDYSASGGNLVLTIVILSAGLFVCCMFCHGELARLKPDPRALTHFYLMVALGGALGSAFVALVAPRVFNEYFEYPIALALAACLAWWLAAKNTPSTVRLGLTLVLIAYVSDLVYAPLKQARFAARDFYGTVKVIDSGEGLTALRTLLHGGISHGSQWLAPERRRQATAYYGPKSGGALAIQHLTSGNSRVGIVGLGPGTLAAYGRPGDSYRFYELDPLVIRIAKTDFTYLRDCQADTSVVQGDARLSLEREPDQHFDVLVLDAFAGDSIPVHLLVKEAFELYFRHLKPQGVLAVHVSNRYMDFTPVVAKVADSIGRSSLAVLSPGDAKEQTLAATWVLVTANHQFLESPVFKAGGHTIPRHDRLRVWTDDYSNLFQVLR